MSLYQRLRIRIRATRYLRKNEPNECRFALACLRPGLCAVDIGAHKAAYTYWMSRQVGRSGQVLAFEPVPLLAQYLQQYARSCRHGNIRVCDVALSDNRGEARLKIPRSDYCWSTLQYEASESLAPQEGCSYVRVPMDTLDNHLNLIHARRPIGFIKCDVEGHELAVFRGATDTLEHDRPAVLFESTPLVFRPPADNPSFDLLNALDYVGYFFFEDELVPLAQYHRDRHPHDHSSVQNFVFLHESRWTLRDAHQPFRVAYHGEQGCDRKAA